jgi:hypothetical protein
MKKLLALLLLFGIVGCASVAPKAIPTWSDTSLCIDMLGESTENISEYQECMKKANGQSSMKDYSKDVRGARLQHERQLKLEEELLKAQTERIESSNSSYTKNRCINILAESSDNYPMYLECMEKFEKEYAEQMAEVNALAASGRDYKKQQEEKRIAVIHALKDRCISYGFTGSNNVAACVQREAQHDYEIEQKDYQLQIAQYKLLVQQSQLSAKQSQPEVAPKVPWYLQALEAVAEGVAEGYKQQALIQTMDSRYEKKDIYRYCRPNC